ncbi:MAG: hypothetical protein M1832_000806 [Thelocarpon impressellum]|nr:MAG: hypothetical protein M1832_000806 [Thelocarpon impressellum]
MVEKRKASTRGREGAASRRRTSTPLEEASSSSESVEEGLPTKLINGQPLPTLDEPQSDGLSPREYQSVAESGVLAASLQRSRHKWLTEGIFERYWTKPSKKKNQVDNRNPPKDTMSKLGPATLTIEPHVFEVTLYSVKDTHAQNQAPPPPLQTLQRPVLQYGPPNPNQLQPTPPKNSSLDQHPASALAANPYAAPPPQNPSLGAAEPHQSTNGGSQRPSPLAPAHLATGHAPPLHPKDSPLPSPTQAGKPSPDPVIQMLATKAATDHELKSLMRVVASGKASSAQLKVFQGHIDELTVILQSQRKANAQNAAASGLTRPSTASLASVPPARHEASRPAQSTHRGAKVNGYHGRGHLTNGPLTPGHSTGVKTEGSQILQPLAPTPPVPPSQPQLLRSKGPPPTAKPEITDVVFDFGAGSSDRFLFPKFSILEYLPGGTQVIASFLVVRKGSNGESGAYDPELDYYQPVTMRLAAQSVKVLDPLARVVASQVEARKYMDDVMDNMTRAEYVHLAMRLPRDPDDVDQEAEKPVEREDRENSMKALYTPPASIGPAKQKIMRGTPLPTERSSSEPWASPGPTPDIMLNRTRKGRVADPNKTCHICHTSSTSLWRKADIEGENVTVCNACGIKWKTNYVRTQEAAHGPTPKKPRGSGRQSAVPAKNSPAPSGFTPIQHSFAPVVTPHSAMSAVQPLREIEMRDT